MFIRQADMSGMRARLVGAQVDHYDTGRQAGKRFARIRHAAAGIARTLNRMGNIKLAAVIRKCFVRGLFNEQVAE